MEWISVKDRLPEKATYVLLTYGIHLPFIALYNGDYFTYNGEKAYGTHWMPLPEPPK